MIELGSKGSIKIMKKYFVISDIHGYYTEMKKALDEAGYDKDNSNHILIVCGDIFDRGPDAVKVYEFLRSIPKKCRILIRGNHELLLKEAVERGYFLSHDFHNKTNITVEQFLDTLHEGKKNNKSTSEYFDKFRQFKIIEWFESEEWVDYYEIKKLNLIFVHSWIPLKTRMPSSETEKLIFSFTGQLPATYNAHWRQEPREEWDEAKWQCPWRNVISGLTPPGKRIVCGHWHTPDFHVNLGHDTTQSNNYNIYYGDKVIAIDSCTAHTKFCNVLVIENNNFYDQYGNLLGTYIKNKKK